jgi:hypothetical protein
MLLARWKYRSVGFSGALTAAVAISSCSTTPQQIYQRSSLGSGQALVVIGVAHDVVPPRVRFTMLLDTYSAETEKTTTTCFVYERPYGPPESAAARYFVYRVPAGIYAAGLDVVPPPNSQGFIARGGQAVYIGDFVRMGDGRLVELKSDLPAAQNAVAMLLPDNLPLVHADSSAKTIHWTASRCLLTIEQPD